VSPRVRLAVFLAAAAGFGALLVWGVAGLPSFGDYRGPYGTVLNQVAVGERKATNVVAAVTWDYRGLDTLGEELILFTCAMGVALLLRETRDATIGRPEDAVRGELVRAGGLLLSPLLVVLGLWVVAHGYITPGGGFQGGVVLAGAAVLLFLCASYRSFRRATPYELVDLAEGFSVAGFVGVGLGTLAAGGVFLENLLPLGTPGSLHSSGTIAIENDLVGLAVAAAFAIVFIEFLEEIEADRVGSRA
jgi:multicomponent Na+:H+ antiporter subunit B